MKLSLFWRSVLENLVSLLRCSSSRRSASLLEVVVRSLMSPQSAAPLRHDHVVLHDELTARSLSLLSDMRTLQPVPPPPGRKWLFSPGCLIYRTGKSTCEDFRTRYEDTLRRAVVERAINTRCTMRAWLAPLVVHCGTAGAPHAVPVYPVTDA